MSLTLSTRLNHAVAPTGVASEIVLLASLVAQEQDKEKSRNPVDLVIVLDVSGSMSGEKLALCKKTLEFLIEQALNENDFLGLVTFDSTITVQYSGGKMNKDNKEVLLGKIRGLNAGSNTNLSGGLFEGLSLLKQFGTAEVSAVCVLTDGQLNEGVTNRDELVKMTQASIASFPAGKAKPSVFTFGYGTDADSNIMNSLSEATGGTYYSIVNPESVPISFADCLGGLTAVAAQNVQLQCEISGVGAELAGNPITKFPCEMLSACACQIKIKDMYCGERRDILFKLRLPAMDTTSPTQVSLSCKYMDTINEKQQTASATTQIERYKGSNLPEGVPDVEVSRHLVRLEAAKTMEEAKLAGDRGDYTRGKQQVDEMVNKAYKIMADLEISEDEDMMMKEVVGDLKAASTNLRSSVAFRTYGQQQMQSAAMSHAFQRSNKVDMLLSSDEAVEQSAYAGKAKKSMMAQAKSAFGF